MGRFSTGASRRPSRWFALLACTCCICLSFACTGRDPEATATASTRTDTETGRATFAATSTTHPRLWLRPADVTRLRARAAANDPMYVSLRKLALQVKRQMDSGTIPAKDTGGRAWVAYPSESYAELLALMSQVSPTQSERDDYGKRARKVLMYAINQAAKGVSSGTAFRQPGFSTGDRSRWWGEGWGLTVDWIYSHLSSSDKATIRKVFVRWVDENSKGSTTNNNHPVPTGVYNSSALTANRKRVRWSGNNYYTAHARNMGLMAMALDPADDPGGTLRGRLKEVTGAWLYVIDNLLRTDCAGGLGPEGFEYTPQAMGYVAQLLLALRTAGEADATRWGRQTVMHANPFWSQLVKVLPLALSPQTVQHAWKGPVYQPAWYGDGQNFYAPDFIGLLGPVGVYDRLRGQTATVDAIRWMETHYPAGGAGGLLDRIADPDNLGDAVMYYLLFDGKKTAVKDPRSGYPLSVHVAGMGHIYARSSWKPDASWFRYIIGWRGIDHQHAEGNHFGFYRKGEWLTKDHVGYGIDSQTSDNHNTLAIENDTPYHNNGYRAKLYQSGSQWLYTMDGDGKLVAKSINKSFVYALGDATKLYNSAYENAQDVVHASRSIIWLNPDHIVVYDRAQSKTSGRYKRFWLQLPAAPSRSGNVSTVTTSKGQKLYITSLLPSKANISVLGARSGGANGEPTKHRLRVSPAGDPLSTRFLHVLQGADRGASRNAPKLIRTSGTRFEGAAVGTTAVLFPYALGGSSTSFTYKAPATVKRHLITGLRPGGAYTVTVAASSSGVTVSVKSGGSQRADSGGVLSYPATKTPPPPPPPHADAGRPVPPDAGRPNPADASVAPPPAPKVDSGTGPTTDDGSTVVGGELGVAGGKPGADAGGVQVLPRPGLRRDDPTTGGDGCSAAGGGSAASPLSALLILLWLMRRRRSLADR